MNQTKKRLSIIKIAISITDIETIQLQVLKLGLLKTDEKIQTIISMLQAENYAQAQGLITTYIESPTENVLQRSSQEKEHVHTQEDQSTIDEFQLFVSPDVNDKKEIDMNDFLSDDLKISPISPLDQVETTQEVQEIDINDFLSVAPTTSLKPIDTGKLDSLLQIDAEDVLSDNIDINIKHTEEDGFFDLSPQNTKESIRHPDIPKDTFFDIDEANNEEVIIEEENTLETEREIENIDTFPTSPSQEDIPIDKSDEDDGVEVLPEENPLETIPDETTEEIHYKAMPYIEEKLESLYKQYPSSYNIKETSSALTELLTKISQESYNEEDVEEVLQNVKKLREAEAFAQAMQFLLVAAATPSPFAQLILARELYSGILLTKNIPQAFILLNTLAMDDYPEALCDLGQFYENGIGTKADKKRATELYKNAMDLGIRRAKNHYERMKQKKKGFFGK